MFGGNVTVAAALVLLSMLPASAKSYHAERYLVHLELDSQGTLQVTETAVFRFDGGPFTYVYRDLSVRETDGIGDITASIDGQPCPPGSGPGAVEIAGTMVRWHFAPTADQARTFTLHYTARGVIRKTSGADTLIWRALPEQRSYTIDAGAITLDYPPQISQADVSVHPREDVERDGSHAAIPLGQVRARHDVVVTARFAPGAFTGPAPQWVIPRAAGRRQFLSGLTLGTFGGLLLVAGVCWWLWQHRSRWPRPSPPHSEPETAPPGSLSPAIAGRLAGRPSSSQAVLLDLARRGAIRIERQEGRFQRDFRLIRQDGAFALAPHEKVLLEATFGSHESITLSSYQQRAAAAAGKFGRAITESLVSAGLYDTERLSQKARVRSLGALLLGAAFTAAMTALLMAKAVTPLVPGILIPLGIGLALSGLAVLAASTQVPVVSDAGALTAGRWKRFAVYLRDIADGRAPLPSLAEWDQWLPYAAALGAAAPLLKRAQREGSPRIPAWFGALESHDNGDSFTAFMTTSSSTGSYGGGDAGAGASGGGSSGAG